MSAKQMNKMTLYVIPIAIALNIVVSNIVFALKLPIWLDSIGVVLTAVISGFWPATIVGVITGLASLITNPSNIFYIPLFVITGGVATILSHYNGYSTFLRSLLSGIIGGITTGVSGSLITIIVYHGLSSTGTGIIAGLLRQIGAPNWLAAMSAGVHSSCRFLHFDCFATAHTRKIPQWREVPPVPSKGYKVSIQMHTK